MSDEVPEQRGPVVNAGGPRCDHICRLDEEHVGRGIAHQYGYEIPSPRDGMSLGQQEELRRLVWRVLEPMLEGAHAEPAVAEPLGYLYQYFLATPGWMPGVSELDRPEEWRWPEP